MFCDPAGDETREVRNGVALLRRVSVGEELDGNQLSIDAFGCSGRPVRGEHPARRLNGSASDRPGGVRPVGQEFDFVELRGREAVYAVIHREREDDGIAAAFDGLILLLSSPDPHPALTAAQRCPASNRLDGFE